MADFALEGKALLNSLRNYLLVRFNRCMSFKHFQPIELLSLIECWHFFQRTINIDTINITILVSVYGTAMFFGV